MGVHGLHVSGAHLDLMACEVVDAVLAERSARGVSAPGGARPGRGGWSKWIATVYPRPASARVPADSVAAPGGLGLAAGSTILLAAVCPRVVPKARTPPAIAALSTPTPHKTE